MIGNDIKNSKAHVSKVLFLIGLGVLVAIKMAKNGRTRKPLGDI